MGSSLAFMRRSNTNGQLSVKNIVWPTQVRALGLRGMGGEDGILTMALNHHFKCKGPSGWHSHAHARRKRQRHHGGSVRGMSDFGDDWCNKILRGVDLSRKPEWFGIPLRDLIARRSIVMSDSFLPRPETFVAPAAEPREHRSLAKTEQWKLKVKQDLGDAMWEPTQLSNVLCKALKISPTSLPTHVRPRPTR